MFFESTDIKLEKIPVPDDMKLKTEAEIAQEPERVARHSIAELSLKDYWLKGARIINNSQELLSIYRKVIPHGSRTMFIIFQGLHSLNKDELKHAYQREQETRLRSILFMTRGSVTRLPDGSSFEEHNSYQILPIYALINPSKFNEIISEKELNELKGLAETFSRHGEREMKEFVRYLNSDNKHRQYFESPPDQHHTNEISTASR